MVKKPRINKKEENLCPPHNFQYKLMLSEKKEKRILYCTKCGEIKYLEL